MSVSAITLRNDFCTAKVERLGAQIVSCTVNGRELLWQGAPGLWSEHAPVLFPICGALKDHRTTIAGKPFAIPKHGFACAAHFDVEDRSEHAVTLVLHETDASRSMYPFRFTLRVTYTLLDQGYATRFAVENNDTCVMPFCIGGHPAIALPLEDHAAFEDHILVFPSAESCGIRRVCEGSLVDHTATPLPELLHGRELPLDRRLFATFDTLVFAGLHSRSVQLLHPASGKRVSLAFPDMEVLAVWTMPDRNASYVCLEPWHGLPDLVQSTGCFEDKPYATLLRPGECWQGAFTVSVNESCADDSTFQR